MLLQTNAIQEVQFLQYLTATILGIELAVYFFYRYFKIKDDKLPLNKILLSYGAYYLLAIVGVFILLVSNLFVSETTINELYYKFGYILIFFSLIAFLYFINIREFSKIINLKIVKVLMIINLIPIILTIFIASTNLFFLVFSITFMLLNFGFFVVFQIRLISTTGGEIRKRLIQLFIGLFLCYVSLLFIAEIIIMFAQLNFSSILFFIMITILITGIIITVSGVYGIPEFYEIKWKENLLRLFIINQKNKTCLYSLDFFNIIEQKIDLEREEDFKTLFSGGIVGIDIVLSAITRTYAEKINKIKQGDSFIYFEYGSKLNPDLTYALVVKQDLSSNRYFLNSIKVQFESFYQDLLKELDKFEEPEQLFGSFNIIINDMMG